MRALSTSALAASRALRPNALLQFLYDGHAMPDQNSLNEAFPGCVTPPPTAYFFFSACAFPGPAHRLHNRNHPSPPPLPLTPSGLSAFVLQHPFLYHYHCACHCACPGDQASLWLDCSDPGRPWRRGFHWASLQGREQVRGSCWHYSPLGARRLFWHAPPLSPQAAPGR